tara:strand:- start:1678 stop:2121 length:444 start_codon:yes stop_codon:yes gene_type:complete
MKKTAQRIELKREAYRKELPQIKLETCRLEQSKGSEPRRFIIEGDPVVLGAILPNVDIGGLPPLKLMASADRKIAVGFVRGTIKNQKVIIDYGFTKDSCMIAETAFGDKDVSRYKLITKPGVRSVRKQNFWRRIVQFFLSKPAQNKR